MGKDVVFQRGVMMSFIWILLLTFIATLGWAYENPTDLTELAIEDLMKIEITSVSKKQQKVFDAAAAIFVITQEDIRRSGVTSIPEALRMAPGVEVAHISANQWAISIRGFNNLFANKLLVLIDGRSVYSPLYSGVFWDIQDTLLEDIERIEVIRGPGATLWGANAVNGVINIITKQAKDTQGGLVSFGGGTEERGFGEVRYGGKIGEGTYYRAYAKYFDRDHFSDTFGQATHDGWNALRGGFRVDSQLSLQDSITAQGDIYKTDSGLTSSFALLYPPFTQSLNEEIRSVGGNILGRWRHTFSNSSDMILQMYYDWTEHQELAHGERRDTFDLDFQHKFPLVEWQEVVWGLGYRLVEDDIRNSFSVAFTPDHRTDHLFSGFVQDDLSLIKDRLRVTLGSKFEHNSYTGFEIQPNVRMLWTPGSRHSIWGAVSRAVRTPARADDDVRYNISALPPDTVTNPSSLPVLISAFGNHYVESEKLIAYELGYRVQATSRITMDIATFYNDYTHLRSSETGMPRLETSPGPLHLLVPITLGNGLKATTYGLEMAIDWRALNWWRLQASYTYLKVRVPSASVMSSTFVEFGDERDPRHQIGLWSWMDLRRDLELNLSFRFVDKLPDLQVKSYVNLDAQLVWKPHKNLELSIVGQNLLDHSHAEFRTESFLPAPAIEVERGVYGRMTWRF
ncbi:MAG: TonB-dependent receptor [Deltaproteobacteria bacterium RBG_13_47_9]|nr:MAG: TonB-dependent receptor [Deltaproteobacteria bacterium RBG_13_47_9]